MLLRHQINHRSEITPSKLPSPCSKSHFQFDVISSPRLSYKYQLQPKSLQLRYKALNPGNDDLTSSSESSQHPASASPSISNLARNEISKELPVLYILQSSLSLGTALSLLIALPAHLSGGGLALAAPAIFIYFIFFATGSIGRVVKYGKLAPKEQDAQKATPIRRIALIAFILAMPIFHWAAWWDYSNLFLPSFLPNSSFLPSFSHSALNNSNIIINYIRLTLAAVLSIAAIWLNAAAASALGPAYNRLVTPKELITSGPYAWIQAPIYTSYMMLFISYAVYLNAPLSGITMLCVCGFYYTARVKTERQILSEAFGEKYEVYASKIGLFLPRIWIPK